MVLAQQWVTVAPWVRVVQRATTRSRLRSYAGNIAIWGCVAGVVAVSFFEPTSLLRNDLLVHLPVVGGYWRKKMEERLRVD